MAARPEGTGVVRLGKRMTELVRLIARTRNIDFDDAVAVARRMARGLTYEQALEEAQRGEPATSR